MKKDFTYDVIVIGGGHAGCEAAYISALLKAKTLLLTINLDTIGETPCNPAFGGAGKSQIIREIDALGGIMPRIVDRSAIQVRMLNTKGGAAVHSLRMQIDREKYRYEMKVTLEKIPNLYVKQGKVKNLLFNNNELSGVICNTGSTYYGKKIIIAAGTFLGGKVILGETEYNAGRYGEPGSYSLSDNLKEIGFNTFKLKTGTPSRIAGNSIDFSGLEKQEHENIDQNFSIWEKNTVKNGRDCYVVRTDDKVHEIIRQNIEFSPLFKGIIEGKGPRYCPSIEDKVVRFFDKDSHKIFLEPEGNNTDEWYMQGFSSSLPEKIQNTMLKTIKGLENCHIFKPGYAVEYYSIDSTQLYNTLESKNIKNLYFAGQVNGTSGYEEAGAQGIIAGINAALSLKNKEKFTLSRNESYIGTLIDDLILKGTQKEPYRMFTSRMDNRMIARQDNAYYRLSEKAYLAGCITEEQFDIIKKKTLKIKEVNNYIAVNK
ncbi:MAG: tRNA uridine-5-carboxymethylaminomethyl(34) synthesis enzyme MnmG, partial [Candidatus Muirbacterium halophilum]|nr:tRNA uridine-5-carboxymethylaminomethyl(34) synthesis enzyme MnmG [Candidatus Muirbacterium halophilum]